MLRGDTPEGTIPWAEFVALHDMVDEEAGLERPQRAVATFGYSLYVGNDRQSQGRHDQPWSEP